MATKKSDAIRTIRRSAYFRIVCMGEYLVVHFHSRFSQLFSPLTWHYTHFSDIDLMEREAGLLCAGRYSELRTRQAREQVQSVPAASLGLTQY